MTEKEEFPYENFPFKLIHTDEKETRTCYFMNKHHLDKHIQRYNLDKKKIKILCKSDNQ